MFLDRKPFEEFAQKTKTAMYLGLKGSKRIFRNRKSGALHKQKRGREIKIGSQSIKLACLKGKDLYLAV